MFSLWVLFMTFIFICDSDGFFNFMFNRHPSRIRGTKKPSDNPKKCNQRCGTGPDMGLNPNPSMLKSKGKKIYGGDAVQGNLYPWIVKLEMIDYDDEKTLCGGSLVSQTHVLTAAHCVSSSASEECEMPGSLKEQCILRPEQITVTFAATIGADRKARAYGVKAVDVHRDMLEKDYYIRHDVALLELEEPAPCNASYTPICLPLRRREPQGRIIVAGYGMDSEKAKTDDPERPLKEGTVTLLDRELCKFFYNDTRPKEEIFCSTGQLTGQSSCKVDSGSSLFSLFPEGYFAMGIVSTGTRATCTFNDTNNDIDVFAHAKWIQAHVHNIPQPREGDSRSLRRSKNKKKENARLKLKKKKQKRKNLKRPNSA